MSIYVLPAERITKALEKWLQVAFNDMRTCVKALLTQDEEEHKGALMVGHSYVFAIKAAHDALFKPEEAPDDVDTPEKRVLYFAKKLIDEMEKEAKDSQPELPGIS